jgi:two-component system, cell cycle sensor histidine kinase and response regulator CckA
MPDRLRVLLVEDNPGDAMLIQEALPADGPVAFEVGCVPRLSMALERLREDHFDVVLLDLGLPDSAGLATVRAALLHTADTPIVVLTGDGDERTGLAVIREGAQDFVVKGQQGGGVLERAIRYAIERGRAKVALRDTERQFRQLVELAPLPLCVVSNDGTVSYVNRRFVQLFGYTHDQVQTLSEWWRLSCPDECYRRRVLSLWEEASGHAALDKKDIEPVECNLTCGDGALRTVVVSGMSIGDSLLVVFVDLTERKRAEEMQSALEARYRRLFEASRDGIMILDADTGEILDVNPFLLDLLGFAREQLLGKRVWELGFLKGVAASRAHFAEMQRQGYVRYDDFPMETANGRRIEVEFISSVYEVNHNRMLQCSIRDLTERKLAEAERAKMEVQLIQAQKLEAIGQLAGGVAHDFNNMLTVILGSAEMALRTLAPSEPACIDIQQILNAGQRSADLTRQLLAFARKQAIAPKVLDLNDAIAGTLKMLRRLIGEDIHLVWVPGHDLCEVKIDPSQLDQILANLAVNARDAISGVGKVTIETEGAQFDHESSTIDHGYASGEYVMLAVSDDGCGMDKVTMGRLFEPFFTTKPLGQGTGLGLATVYGIVKQNEGFVSVYSEPGTGTTFKIYLPRHRSSKPIAALPMIAEPLPGTETLLLVEDERMLLGLTKKMLEELGYAVLAANGPTEALRLTEKNVGDIHLVLTDVIMPGMSGRDLWDKLSALRPQMKCVFMSGHTADVIADHGVLDEGVHFLSKPFSRSSLAAKLREALARP